MSKRKQDAKRRKPVQSWNEKNSRPGENRKENCVKRKPDEQERK